MHLVVGLGNPGTRYAATRHNVGFRVVERLADRSGARVERKLFGALVGEAVVGGKKATLAMPQQYMNVSGQPTASLLGFFKVPAAEMVVLHDDLDLPLGKLRVRVGGGHGGHNGVRDIQRACGADFVRVRMGVGRPPPQWETADYVLSGFTSAESSAVDAMVETAADAVESVVRDGVAATMNRFNAVRPEPAVPT
jgi:peptidyl-tRNA hydrolase, PTH1 family